MRDELFLLEEKLIPGNGGITQADAEWMLKTWRAERDMYGEWLEESSSALQKMHKKLEQIAVKLETREALEGAELELFKKRLEEILAIGDDLL